MKEKDEFFKLHGARWFEFARLSYFDPMRMVIIDPMHNLLLGDTFETHLAHSNYLFKVLLKSSGTKFGS